MDDFIFKPKFWKKHQGYIVHGSIEKWGSEVGNRIEPVFVRMYVYMS